jgi:hypothetical protein
MKLQNENELDPLSFLNFRVLHWSPSERFPLVHRKTVDLISSGAWSTEIQSLSALNCAAVLVLVWSYPLDVGNGRRRLPVMREIQPIEWRLLCR